MCPLQKTAGKRDSVSGCDDIRSILNNITPPSFHQTHFLIHHHSQSYHIHISTALILDQKPQKRSRNRKSIMRLPNPLLRILSLRRIENALLVPHRDQIAHKSLVKFRMTLHRNELPLSVHALHETSRRTTQCFHAFWVLKNNISVHLVDALEPC
jgi:hypothetical protein